VIKLVLPEFLLDWYRSVRALGRRVPDQEPWDLNGMTRDEVEDLLREGGARVVGVIQDGPVGPRWVSLR
jgi:hypothetical protein